MTALLLLATLGAATHAPCEAPPVGMACVPGGPAVLGADDKTDAERPRHTAELPTYYLDRTEVTNADYERCAKTGACPAKWGRVAKSYGPFLTPTQPALPMSWDMANAYCVWAGKRLPTEAEWEKAARGGDPRTYPWGEAPPSCDKANYKGCPGTMTKPVGSHPAGPFGIFDLAGNGYEWVQDFWTESYTACGAACQGDDPRGPCGGAATCKGLQKRVLKGGSWHWEGELGRGSWRRGERPESGMHRLGFRCASSAPVLATWPALHKTDPLPDLGDPAPPTPEELQKFRSFVEDTDILQIKECRFQGDATHDCRDPMSYITTNEQAHHVWRPYVANLGGGYVGLGSDQGYGFLSAAKSRWAWLFDYDPAVVRVHYIVRAIVQDAETPLAFVSAFAPNAATKTKGLIEASLAHDPAEQKETVKQFLQLRDVLWKHYFKSMQPTEFNKSYGWLRNKDQYRYVRLMFTQGRIAILKGNLLTDKALPSIARAANALGTPIRVFYPSNAEEQWELPQQYKDNLLGFPFDDRSVILRTYFSQRWGDKSQSYWHYVVHDGKHCQRLLAGRGFDHVGGFLTFRRKTELPMISVIGLPGRTEREAAPAPK